LTGAQQNTVIGKTCETWLESIMPVWAGGVAQVAKLLPRKCEALSLNPSTEKKKQKEVSIWNGKVCEDVRQWWALGIGQWVPALRRDRLALALWRHWKTLIHQPDTVPWASSTHLTPLHLTSSGFSDCGSLFVWPFSFMCWPAKMEFHATCQLPSFLYFFWNRVLLF
jgi:hypothetical protein